MSANTETENLDRSMVRAIAWTGAAMWTAQAFSWVSTIYVARLLAPTDYGVFALAGVYMGLVSLVSELGLGSAVVVLRNLGKRQLAELNTLSIFAGLACVAISCLAAYPIGTFFSSSDLPLVIVVMSLQFIVSSPKVVPDSLLQQELRFKLLAHMDALRAFAQAASTMAAAMMGLGYWSLVIGSLVGAGLGTCMTLFFRRHSFAWPSLVSLRPALGLSRDLLVTRVGWYLFSNADFVIVGRLLGEAPLGAYRLAWSIANIPIEKITVMVMRTSQPFFSSVQKDQSAIRRYLVGLTQGLALATIPASIGLSLVSDKFVALVLETKWEAVALPLAILALCVPLRSLTPLVPAVLNVVGQSRFVAWNTFLATFVLVPAFIIGAQWGPAGVATAWLTIHPLIVLPLYQRAFRQIRLSARQYIAALWPAFQATVALTAGVLLVRYGLPSGWPLGIQLTLLIAAGVVSYAAFLLIFHRDTVQQLKQLVALLRG